MNIQIFTYLKWNNNLNNNEVLTQKTAWMNLKSIMNNEYNQEKIHTYTMNSFI